MVSPPWSEVSHYAHLRDEETAGPVGHSPKWPGQAGIPTLGRLPYLWQEQLPFGMCNVVLDTLRPGARSPTGPARSEPRSLPQGDCTQRGSWRRLRSAQWGRGQQLHSPVSPSPARTRQGGKPGGLRPLGPGSQPSTVVIWNQTGLHRGAWLGHPSVLSNILERDLWGHEGSLQFFDCTNVPERGDFF